MKTSRLLLIAACAALFFAAACGTSKEASRTPSSASIVPPADATPAVRFEAMTAAYGMWHDLQVPMRATLRSPMNMSASGRLTMVRDSLVHISMRVLGIEVAVLRVGRDSVHVFDKFHRYYAAESMAALSRRTGLTLADVQCALLGRAFMPGRGVATASMASRLRLGGDESLLTIAPLSAPEGYTWSMDAARLGDGRIALSALSVRPQGAPAATCAYTPAASLTPAGAMASALELNAVVAKKKLSASLSYTLADARWNAGAVPAMPSTRGYTRIDPAAILKAGF